MSNKLLVVIGGPTGVGKTDVAIRLAQHYRTEILNADSRQVYKELSIGVGRPANDQLAAVPHHLIGITTIFEHYSVGHFATDALTILDELFQQHDIVILTGGSGLYVKAIMEGFDEFPDVDIKIMDKWTRVWKEQGTPALLESLKTLDPAFLDIVDQSNHMRLIRALSVSESAGKPFSSFRKGHQATRSFHILPIVLELPREELYKKIDQRVNDMIASGWVSEATSLYPHRALKALQTVGYKELFEFMNDKITLPEAIASIQQSTRRYAKRQLTWWRHQGSWHSFSPDNVSAIIKVIDFELEARSKELGAGSRS